MLDLSATPAAPYEPIPDQGETQLAIDELVKLAAVSDRIFFSSFFPRTFRQEFPEKVLEMAAAMDDPNYRLVNLRAFRGSSKTTLLRAKTAKRIAYGIGRTILYVGASEPHASRSVQWLRTQIKGNRLFYETFGLRMGRKDNDTEIEIINDKLGCTSWVLGAGITGNIRGINFDDYRPDTIICDDILTDETAATAEQRTKISGLVYGALRNSLAPISEAPDAKLLAGQTPLNREDPFELAKDDPEWLTITFPCWTPETMDLPVHQQISAWPERFPTEELRKQKLAAAARNELSTFIREMEVRLANPETSAFKGFWLLHRPKPARIMQNIIAVDLLPPPTDRAVAKNLHGKDFEAIVVIGREGEDYHILDYAKNRGHEPNWTVDTVLGMHQRWRSLRLVAMPVAYEQTFKWILEQEMKRKGYYITVKLLPRGKQSKFHLITNALSGIASNGHLWISPTMVDLIDDFTNYPNIAHDDLLDAIAVGLTDFVNPYLELGGEEGAGLPPDEPELELLGRAP